MSCNGVRIWYNADSRICEASLYICNCNGIRERDARLAIEAGATRPAHIFRHAGCRAECAKCVCDMREMIEQQHAAFRLAAE